MVKLRIYIEFTKGSSLMAKLQDLGNKYENYTNTPIKYMKIHNTVIINAIKEDEKYT